MDSRLEEFERAVENKKKKRQVAIDNALKRKYQKAINSGDWSVIVPEFETYDQFELYKETIQKNVDIPDWGKTDEIQIEDRSDFMKKEIEIRLSKDYNVGSVKVVEIESQDWESTKEWAMSEARDIWSKLPDSNKNNTTKTQSKQQYQQTQASNTVSAEGYIELSKQARGYGTDKQWGIYNKNIDKVKTHPRFNPHAMNDYATFKDAISFIFGK